MLLPRKDLQDRSYEVDVLQQNPVYRLYRESQFAFFERLQGQIGNLQSSPSWVRVSKL